MLHYRMSDSELKYTDKVAQKRLDYARDSKRGSTYGGLSPWCPGALEQHQQGTATEFSSATILGLPWYENVGTIKARDIDDFIDVRAVRDWGRRLILHPNDEDEVPFVLTLDQRPLFTLRGWLLAGDGKRKEFWQDPTKKGRHAWFVPNKMLRPMEEIFPLVAAHLAKKPLSSIGQDAALSRRKAGVSTP